MLKWGTQCHQTGHWSAECPNSGDSGRGGGGAGGGYNAGQSRSKDTDECYKVSLRRNRQKIKTQIIVQLQCHQTGHWSSACPNSGDSGSGGGYSKPARNKYNNNNDSGGDSGYSCFKCGEPGECSSIQVQSIGS